VNWACAVCGISRDVANERRASRGLRPVRANTPCCSPECARTYEASRAREQYGRGSGYRYPIPRSWRCAVCGRRADDQLHRARADRQLAPLTRYYKTCTPECAAKLPHGVYADRAKWRCSECGRAFREADVERISEGLDPLPATAVTCSEACEAVRAQRLGPGWHCTECGASSTEALARGTRINSRSETCSPECSRRRGHRRTKGLLRVRAARQQAELLRAARALTGANSAEKHVL
jgi:hypothetical protein